MDRLHRVIELFRLSLALAIALASGLILFKGLEREYTYVDPYPYSSPAPLEAFIPPLKPAEKPSWRLVPLPGGPAGNDRLHEEKRRGQ